ncbi:MAG: tetratricopeptide repeat protein [Pseudomonadota bacterium]|nr:tetratricopeptide repeat protein [Pseudomonadota bacterium]
MKGFVSIKGEQDVYTLITRINLGSVLTLVGELEESIMQLRKAVEGLAKLMGEKTSFTKTVRYNIADALLEAGRVEDGAVLFEEVPIEALQAPEPAARWPARFKWQRGRISALRGEHALAEPNLREAIEQLGPTEAVDRWMAEKARGRLTTRCALVHRGIDVEGDTRLNSSMNQMLPRLKAASRD